MVAEFGCTGGGVGEGVDGRLGWSRTLEMQRVRDPRKSKAWKTHTLVLRGFRIVGADGVAWCACFQSAEKVDEGAWAVVALASLEAEVAVAVADDAAGFPIALRAGRFDFELPIFPEIIEGDKIAHDGMAVVEKSFSCGN